MKNVKEWIIVILSIAILMFALAGFVSKNHDIVDKQDELSEIYTDIQTLVQKEIKRFNELQAQATVLEKLKDSEDVGESVEVTVQLKQIVTEATPLAKSINQKKTVLTNLKFAYGILQEMR